MLCLEHPLLAGPLLCWSLSNLCLSLAEPAGFPCEEMKMSSTISSEMQSQKKNLVGGGGWSI